eukprot:8538875-Alexandrium_andersonii.AAC.1
MSASLVGSEMCIRDRSSAGRVLDRWIQSAMPDGGKRRKGEKTQVGLFKGCLLYTSDAADDM